MINYSQILELNRPKTITDSEYLEEYLHSFYKIYITDIAYIKNIEGQYIALTPNFTNLIGVPANKIICKFDKDLPSQIASFSETVNIYEKYIEKTRRSLTFLDINEYANGIGLYVFNKKPIINPNTKKVVGILCYGEKYKSNNMLKIMLDIHTKPTIIKQTVKQTQLPKTTIGAKQSEILFCLLLGMKEYKVIAEFINTIKGSDYSHRTVDNALKELYLKFNVNGRDALIQAAFLENHHLNFPKSLLKFGSYPINNAEAIVI